MLREKIKGIFAAFFYRCYSLTFRYEIMAHEGFIKEAFKRNREKGDGMLLAFWHQDELALLPFFKKSGIVILVSDSRDGIIMNTVLKCFGYNTVRGSSTRGGHKGFIGGYKKLLKGAVFAMAVDGPRGPIYEAKVGMAHLSKKSKIPVVPIHAYPVNHRVLHKSWNKGRFPMPFTKIIIKTASPNIYSTKELTDTLNSLKGTSDN